MKHLIKSVTVLENSAGIHYVPLQHFFILSKKHMCCDLQSIARKHEIKKMRRITRHGIPTGITTFSLSLYVTFHNTYI